MFRIRRMKIACRFRADSKSATSSFLQCTNNCTKSRSERSFSNMNV